MRFLKATLIIILFVIISACSKNTSIDPIDKLNEKRELVEREILTKDRQTTFIVHNEPGLSKEKIEKITDEIETSYGEIVKYSNGYEWEKEIHIYLKGQNLTSYAKKDEIVLYNTRGNNYPLTHELTHALLGVGNPKRTEFNREHGLLIQEGFGVYLEEKLYPERNLFPSNGLDTHQVMKYLIETNQTIPMIELANNSISLFYFNQNEYPTMWRSYVHAGSFVRYLFENYDRDLVIKLYNSPKLIKDVKTVLGVDIKKVEEDWLNYVKVEVQELTTNEKSKILYP